MVPKGSTLRVLKLMQLLGPEASAKLLNSLQAQDVQKIINQSNIHQQHLKKIEIAEALNILKNFAGDLNQESFQSFDPNFGQNVLERLGTRFQHLQNEVFRSQKLSMPSLEDVDEKSLLSYLSQEHPQTIALIMLFLPPPKQAHILPQLPEGLMLEVVLRMSQKLEVRPDIVKDLDDMIRTTLLSKSRASEKNLGGIESMAEMLTKMGDEEAEKLLQSVATKDPSLEAALRSRMVILEDIIYLDQAPLRQVLRQFSFEKWVKALRATGSDELRETIYQKIRSCLSENQKKELSEQILLSKPVRRKDSDEIRLEILNWIKKQAASNEQFDLLKNKKLAQELRAA